MTGERSLVVAVADWPVVAAGAGPGEPAVVVEGNRVVAATAAARAAGVRVGSRRREAQARCPEVRVMAGDRARDGREFEPVVAAVAELCPRLEVLAPGWCGFPTRGPSRYFGGDGPLARRVLGSARAVVGQRGAVRVGVADGRFTARLAATATPPEGDGERPGGGDGRGGGTSGGDGDGPGGGESGRDDGVVVVPAGASAAWLAPFPVSVLAGEEGVAAGLVDLLARLGLRSLGAVAGLPAGDVVARFGPEGTAAYRLASGLDAHPAVLCPPPESVAVQTVFEDPVERTDRAAFAARALAGELHERLEARGESCTLLAVVAETEHGERFERRWRQDGPLSMAAVAERVRWQLEGWLDGSAARRPSAGITLLRLVPEEVVPARGVQLRLWGSSTAAPDRVVKVLARLEGLLGPEAVTVPEWRGGRHPGDQVRAVPASTVEPIGERVGTSPPASVVDPGRPPWPGRLPPPSPATVLGDRDRLRVEVLDASGEPVRVDGRAGLPAAPAEVVLDGHRRRVAAWAGPWPVVERWWDRDGRRRQARFQLLLDDGTGYLLALEGGRWYLAALYD